MKNKICNWLFGWIFENIILQTILIVLVMLHIFTGAIWYIAWLVHFLPWPK